MHQLRRHDGARGLQIGDEQQPDRIGQSGQSEQRKLLEAIAEGVEQEEDWNLAHGRQHPGPADERFVRAESGQRHSKEGLVQPVRDGEQQHEKEEQQHLALSEHRPQSGELHFFHRCPLVRQEEGDAERQDSDEYEHPYGIDGACRAQHHAEQQGSDSESDRAEHPDADEALALSLCRHDREAVVQRKYREVKEIEQNKNRDYRPERSELTKNKRQDDLGAQQQNQNFFNVPSRSLIKPQNRLDTMEISGPME